MSRLLALFPVVLGALSAFGQYTWVAAHNTGSTSTNAFWLMRRASSDQVNWTSWAQVWGNRSFTGGENYTNGLYYGNNNWYYQYELRKGSSSGSVVGTASHQITGYATVLGHIYFDAVGAPTWYTNRLSFTNLTVGNLDALVTYDSLSGAGVQFDTITAILPREVVSYSLASTNGYPSISIQPYPEGGSPLESPYGPVAGTNLSSGVSYAPPPANGDDPGIVWSNGSDAARDSTLKEGFKALYNAMTEAQARDEALSGSSSGQSADTMLTNLAPIAAAQTDLLEELKRIRAAEEWMTNAPSLLSTNAGDGLNYLGGDPQTKSMMGLFLAEQAFQMTGIREETETNGWGIAAMVPGDATLWTIDVFGGDKFHYVLDLFPTRQAWLANVAAAVRFCATWSIGIWTFWVIFKRIEASWLAVVIAPQGRTSGQEAAGFNLALPSALVTAGVIVAVVAAALTALLSIARRNFPGSVDLAAGGISPAISTAFYLVDQWVPVTQIFGAITAIVATRVGLMCTVGIRTGIVRFLVGL